MADDIQQIVQIGKHGKPLLQTPSAIAGRKWARKNADYSKNWRAKNPEKVKLQTAKHAVKNNKVARQWALDNPDEYRNYQKQWNVLNAEKRREYDRKRTLQRYVDRKAWSRYKVEQVRARAKQINVPFDLTEENIYSLIPKDECCPVLGMPFAFKQGRNRWDIPTIDRIIPSRGYVFGNVRIICFRANSIKQDSVDPNEIRRVADYLESCIAEVQNG